MKAGVFNRRITIQQRSVVQDSIGEPSENWCEMATVWASIQDISGREFLTASAEQNGVQTKITIRYRDGIVPAMRVKHHDTIYKILSVLGSDRITLLLMCERLM